MSPAPRSLPRPRRRSGEPRRPAAPPPVEPYREIEALLRTACHELRSHLSCALLSGQLLQDEALRRGLDEASQRAATIVTATLRMDALLEELSESTHLACGPIELHPQRLQLDDLLAATLRAAAPPEHPAGFDASRVDLRATPALPAVRGDAGRLERAFRCLLSRALSASPRGRVEVAVTGAAGEVQVTVADHGPGLPPEDLPLVFGRYYRPPGASDPRGLGVELFIARRLVEAHGGRVWVESEGGCGVTYGVALPAATPPRPRDAPERLGAYR